MQENLCYNKEGVSDEILEQACRACGVWYFVETLPGGLDSMLNENISISAEQKQLYTIACAMVQNHQMLILGRVSAAFACTGKAAAYAGL